MSADQSFPIPDEAHLELFIHRLRKLRAAASYVVGYLPPDLAEIASRECELLYTMFRSDIDHVTRADALRALRNEDQQS